MAPLSLVAPAALIATLERLAAVTGGASGDGEWLRAANEHLIRVYRLVKAYPDDPVFPDATGEVTTAFLASAEAYLKQTRQWPLRDMLRSPNRA
jgi:hypothetical protein